MYWQGACQQGGLRQDREVDHAGSGSIRVLLVRTHSPGNLGAAARACRNFGARLALLDPIADPTHPDAIAFASGAENWLTGAERPSTWVEVERASGLVVALSSLRGRDTRGLPPALSWSSIRSGNAGPRPYTLVFGPERSGLTRDEVSRCGARLRIDTDPAFPTLSLSHSVAIALALSAPAGRTVERARLDIAGAALTGRLRRALQEALERDPGSASAARELAATLDRARLSRREAELWLLVLARGPKGQRRLQ